MVISDVYIEKFTLLKLTKQNKKYIYYHPFHCMFELQCMSPVQSIAVVYDSIEDQFTSELNLK